MGFVVPQCFAVPQLFERMCGLRIGLRSLYKATALFAIEALGDEIWISEATLVMVVAMEFGNNDEIAEQVHQGRRSIEMPIDVTDEWWAVLFGTRIEAVLRAIQSRLSPLISSATNISISKARYPWGYLHSALALENSSSAGPKGLIRETDCWGYDLSGYQLLFWIESTKEVLIVIAEPRFCKFGSSIITTGNK